MNGVDYFEIRRPFVGRVHKHVLLPAGGLCEVGNTAALCGRIPSMNITIADFCFSMLLPASLNRVGRSTSVWMIREAALAHLPCEQQCPAVSSASATCAIDVVGCCCIRGTGAAHSFTRCPVLHIEASMFNGRPRDFSRAASFPFQPHINP